jgi:hypothetical protein
MAASRRTRWLLVKCRRIFIPQAFLTPGIYNSGVGGNIAGGSGAGTSVATIGTNSTGVRVTSSNGLDTVNSSGGGGSHNNMMPFIPLWPKVKL